MRKMPKIIKFAGDKVTVKAIIKNVGADLSHFKVRLRLASPYITYQLTYPEIGSFKSGSAIDWTGIFTIGTDWLTGDYTLVFVGMDGEKELPEIVTDWIISLYIAPT